MRLITFLRQAVLIFSLLLFGFVLVQCGNHSDVPVNPVDSTLSVGEQDTLAVLEKAAAPVPKLNYMRLYQGMFKDTFNKKVPSTNRADVSKTFDALIDSGEDLVIYFHGGMIPLKKAYRFPNKSRLHKLFSSAGKYPYYILYGADPKELWANRPTVLAGDDVRDNNEEVYEEDEISELDKALDSSYRDNSYVYLQLRLNRYFNTNSQFHSMSGQPIQDTTNLLEQLKSEVRQQKATYNRLTNKAKPIIPAGDFTKSLLKDSVLKQLAKLDIQKTPFLYDKQAIDNPVSALYDIDKIVVSIEEREKAGRDHGEAMTCTEEAIAHSSKPILVYIKKLLRHGWDMQKFDVLEPFKSDPLKYGGRALLDELVLFQDSMKKVNKVRKIYLVGSSTGAIMICNMLIASAEEKYSSLKYNVIFTVPSCTMSLFAQSINMNGNNIESVNMFSLSDSTDKVSAAWFIQDLYPGSILFMVSSICESKDNKYHDMPLVGLQRFYSADFSKSVVSDEERKAIATVMRKFETTSPQSYQIDWSFEKSLNKELVNKGSNHKRVILNKDVQKSIKYLITH
ncbi:MAG: hypothetical protein H7Y31_05550 [Chitinophagaceae bacterium]|nr:hypothetical protein [Chitinophagaceae bacterium]